MLSDFIRPSTHKKCCALEIFEDGMLLSYSINSGILSLPSVPEKVSQDFTDAEFSPHNERV